MSQTVFFFFEIFYYNVHCSDHFLACNGIKLEQHAQHEGLK